MKLLYIFGAEGQFLLASAVLAATLGTLSPSPAHAEASGATAVNAEAPAAADGAGMRAYVDPRTRRFVVPPPEEVPAAGPGSAAFGAAELTAEPSVVPGGGTVLNLHGTHRFGLTASTSGTGQPVIHCDDVAPHDTSAK